MPDKSSRELDISEGSFGRENFQFQCRTGDGKIIPIAHGDVAVTRFKGQRCHFRIFEKGEVFYVQDMGSGNGTYLNGKQLPGFISGKGSDAIRLPDRCRLKVGQREITFEVLSTQREKEKQAKLRKAGECMEYGIYKRAAMLFEEVGDFVQAKLAHEMHEQKKMKKYQRNINFGDAKNVINIMGDFRGGKVGIEDRVEDLRGLSAEALGELGKQNLRRESMVQDGKTRRREIGREEKIDAREFEMVQSAGVVHDSASRNTFRECSCCGNVITEDNKRLKCKQCGIFFCTTCEGWIDKMTECGGIEIRVQFPSCEKCYGETVIRKMREIDGG